MDHSLSSALFHNKYKANCTGDLDRASCQLSEEETAKRDVVACLRMIFALLSILGTMSIIVSVVKKKQVFNPKIHTIFMLSVADLMLAVLWVMGGGVWMSGGMGHTDHSRVGCFTIVLSTVILECVAINLTCVYALLAYSSIRRKDFSNAYSLLDKNVETHVWKPRRIIMVYILSWILPVFLIMIPFAIVARNFDLVKETNSCSCWCLPYFGNVVPLASSKDNDTAYYMHHMSMLVASYGLVLVGNYLVGSILLVIVYWKTLKLIQRMKKSYIRQTRGSHKTYGITSNVIVQGQSRAKKRVIYFLTVFVIGGIFNLFLSAAFVIYDGIHLRKVPIAEGRDIDLPWLLLLVYIGQSITVPLQGFLNAIVYGWTRDDFVLAVRSGTINEQNKTDRLFKEQSDSDFDSNVGPSLVSSDGDSSIHVGRSWAGRDALSSIPELPETNAVN